METGSRGVGCGSWVCVKVGFWLWRGFYAEQKFALQLEVAKMGGGASICSMFRHFGSPPPRTCVAYCLKPLKC